SVQFRKRIVQLVCTDAILLRLDVILSFSAHSSFQYKQVHEAVRIAVDEFSRIGRHNVIVVDGRIPDVVMSYRFAIGTVAKVFNQELVSDVPIGLILPNANGRFHSLVVSAYEKYSADSIPLKWNTVNRANVRFNLVRIRY